MSTVQMTTMIDLLARLLLLCRFDLLFAYTNLLHSPSTDNAV